MVTLCQQISDSVWFQRFITAIILLAGVVVGLETDATLRADYHGFLQTLNQLILAVFVLEIAIKIVAKTPRWWEFFYDSWNLFDFIIIAGCLLPFASQYLTVLRLLRLLRVLRLIRAIPRLQLIVSALLKSIPSMFYISILLSLFFYVYAVAAIFMFGANDPIHFHSLPKAMLSLFRVITLEDWTDIMYINMYGCAAYGYEGNESLCVASSSAPILASLFFVSFVLIGTMIMLNLFIGVIMKGMEEASLEVMSEQQRHQQNQKDDDLHKEVNEIHEQLDKLLAKVNSLKIITEKDRR